MLGLEIMTVGFLMTTSRDSWLCSMHDSVFGNQEVLYKKIACDWYAFVHIFHGN